MKERIQNALAPFWQKTVDQVRSSPTLQQAMQWYSAQTERDQRIIKAVGVCIILALVFVIIYAPLMQAKELAASQLERNKATYTLIADNAGKFGGKATQTETALLTAITQQARASNITLSRYEQDGQALRVWLDKIPFDDAIAWLEALQSNYAIRATQVSVDQTDLSGRVDIRATLSR